MHPTAMQNGREFLDAYFPAGSLEKPLTVVDIGAQDVNGSLKDLMRPQMTYVGVDFVAGQGVDVILRDPYVLPFEDGYADVVLSSSCFEHSEMFWVLFLEALRILKPAGLFYLNVPSNGDVHRYPVDCWRFYPDSGKALVTWARRNGLAPQLLESYTSVQIGDIWNDYVAVFVKDDAQAARHPRRILHSKKDVFNGYIAGRPEPVNPEARSEDQNKLALVDGIVNNRIKVKLDS